MGASVCVDLTSFYIFVLQRVLISLFFNMS